MWVIRKVYWYLYLFNTGSGTFSSRFSLDGLLNFRKHFMRLVSLSLVHLKRACESPSLFLQDKQGIRVCVVPNFHPGLRKISIIWKVWNFYPGLKFHLSLDKLSWNFNPVFRVEIFTCNCNVILKMSFLYSRDEISTRFNKLKLQLGLKIFIKLAP